MAALDFPASPTVNQLATLTNGFTYQWDGAVWTLAASTGQQAGGDLTGSYPNPTLVPAQKNLWAASGVNITPVDSTDQLIVPGPTATVDQAQLVLGTGTVKGRVAKLAGIDWTGITNNAWYDGAAWHQDDTAKPSWIVTCGGPNFYLSYMTPGGTTPSNPLSIDSTGKITLPGPTGTVDQAQLVLGSPKMRVQALCSGWSGINWNDWYDGAAWHQDNPANPSWHLANYTDSFYLERRAASNGASTMPLTLDGAGNMKIAGDIIVGATVSVPAGIRCQNIAGATGSTYSNTIGLGWNGNLQARVDSTPIGSIVVTGAGTGAGNNLVTRAMLAVGAASSGYSVVATTANQLVSGGAGWVKITPDCSITTRGGVVVMILTAAGRYTGNTSSNEVILGWGRDGAVALGVADYPCASSGGAGLYIVPIPGFVAVDYGPAGTHTYSAWAYLVNTNGSFQGCPGSAYLYVVELS